MDAFEVNKIVGAVLFALLVLFSARTASDIIFTVHKPEKPGYEVAVAEPEAPAEKAEEKKEVPLAMRLADASAEKGKSVAKKCTACHTFDSGGANKVGPNLHGVVGRALASHEGFSYSDALKEKGGDWDYEKLDAFLANPKGFAQGTKMAFAGVKDGGQRADLILYLRDVSPDAPPLPEAKAEAPAEQPAAEAPAEQPAPAQGH
jgi:cytochrome c